MTPESADVGTQPTASQRKQFDNYAAEAREAERSEQFPLAIELLERALDQVPGDFACRMQLASLSNRVGHIDRAMVLYRQLLPEAPNDSVLLNNVGSVYFDLGHFDRGMDLYRESIEKDPSNFLPHANLAYSHALMGQKKEALEYAEALTRLVPHSRYQPFVKVAMCRAYLANGLANKAAAFLINATIDDKQNLLFNLQRLLLAKELCIEDEVDDILVRNLHRAKESLHRGLMPHKIYYRLTIYHLIAGSHRLAMQAAKSALTEGPYRGIIRFAGLYYLEQLGLPETDKIYKLWHKQEEAIPLPDL